MSAPKKTRAAISAAKPKVLSHAKNIAGAKSTPRTGWKPRVIYARDVVVDNRRLDGVLSDVDERIKIAEARSAEARAEYEAHHAKFVALHAENEARRARYDALHAEYEARHAYYDSLQAVYAAKHAEHQQNFELLMRTLSAQHKDFVAVVQQMREDREKSDARFRLIEQRVGLAAE